MDLWKSNIVLCVNPDDSLYLQAIGNDSNAEKLSATYEPQVCLSKEAFLQLLNNSSEFTEAWELPIWVKMNPMNGEESLHVLMLHCGP